MSSLDELKELQNTPQSANKIWALCENSYLHGSPWSEEQFNADLSHASSHYLVYDEDQTWSGFVSYYQMFDEADITHVVVEKSRQHTGVGRRMLEKVIQYLKKNEVRKVFLEVRASNISAVKLYKTLGFRVISLRKNYYHQPTEDGLVMELRIEERI